MIRRVRFALVLLSVVAFAAVTAYNAGWLGRLLPFGMSPHLQMALFVGGVAALVAAFPPRLALRRRAQDAVRLTPSAVAVAAAFFLALVLRVHALDTTIHFFVDEVNFAIGMTQYWDSTSLEILLPRVMSFPGVFSYYQALAVDLFGRDLFALRLATAVVGALTVPAVYTLGRALFSRRVALAAAVVLATFPPHLHFSRLALNNAVDPLFGTLALAALAWGVRLWQLAPSASRRCLALSGVWLGLTQYFYEGGRLLFPAVYAAVAVALWLFARPRHAAASAGQGAAHAAPGTPFALLSALFTFVLVAAPAYITLLANGYPLLTRINDTGLNARFWTDLLLANADSAVFTNFVGHVIKPFQFYLTLRDASLFYSGTLHNVVSLPLFVVGLVVLLVHLRRRPFGLVPLLWLALCALGNTLLVDPLQSPRYVVVFPALALVAGVGAVAAFDALARLIGSRPRTAAQPHSTPSAFGVSSASALPLTAYALLCLLALVQTVYYFAVHVPAYTAAYRAAQGMPDAQDAIFRSLDFPRGTTVHIVSDPPGNAGYLKGVADFHRPALYIRTLTPADFNADYLNRLPLGSAHAFFFAPDDAGSVALLARYFALPEPQPSPFYTPPPDLPPDAGGAFLLYYLPAR